MQRGIFFYWIREGVFTFFFSFILPPYPFFSGQLLYVQQKKDEFEVLYMHNKIRAIIIIFYDFSIIFLNWSQNFSKNKNNYNHNRKINFNRMVLMITSCIINDLLLEFIDFRVRGNMMRCICQDCPKYISLLVVLFLNILYKIFFESFLKTVQKYILFVLEKKTKMTFF